MMDADKNYSELFLTFLIFQQELFYDIQPNKYYLWIYDKVATYEISTGWNVN